MMVMSNAKMPIKAVVPLKVALVWLEGPLWTCSAAGFPMVMLIKLDSICSKSCFSMHSGVTLGFSHILWKSRNLRFQTSFDATAASYGRQVKFSSICRYGALCAGRGPVWPAGKRPLWLCTGTAWITWQGAPSPPDLLFIHMRPGIESEECW